VTAAVTLGAGRLELSYQVVRAVVPALDEDRVLGPDVERVAALVASGDLVAGVRRALAEDVSSAGPDANLGCVTDSSRAQHPALARHR